MRKPFKVVSDVKDSDGNILVTAYALERPDGQWSILLVNKDKDQDHDHPVSVRFADPVAKHDRFFTGTVDRVIFGAAEYQWHPDPVPAGTASQQQAEVGAAGGQRQRIP
jgi:hypothetical protein